jgi:hypothetical protein
LEDTPGDLSLGPTSTAPSDTTILGTTLASTHGPSGRPSNQIQTTASRFSAIDGNHRDVKILGYQVGGGGLVNNNTARKTVTHRGSPKREVILG